MKGRLENNLKTENNIQKILCDLPNYVSMYYYSISPSTTPKTCETYLKQIRGYLKYISMDCKNINLSDINEYTVGRYLKTIQTKNNRDSISSTSFSYQKTIWSSLNGFCSYLEREEYIVKNPLKHIKRPVYQDEVKRILLKKEDINKIIKQVDIGVGSHKAKTTQERWTERDKLIILLFISTGMRCSALSEINIEDVSILNSNITIMDKRNITHKYFMSEQLKTALEEWLNRRNEMVLKNEQALFISSYKSRLTSKAIYNIIQKYSKEALGFSISPHKLRAAFCTILYNETHDIEFVREAVGHKNVTTTSRYIVKNIDIKKQASDIMASLI